MSEVFNLGQSQQIAASPQVQNPVPPLPVPDISQAILVLQKWRRVMSLRWLVLIATLGALGAWGATVADPTLWRCLAACGYSVLVLVPVFILYSTQSDR